MRYLRLSVTAGLVFGTSLLFSQGTSLDYGIPAGLGEKVDPAAPPPRADLFWTRHGPDFVVYWDRELATPRYISPRAELRLGSRDSSGELDEGSLVSAARELVTANREFFGASGDDLLGPSVTRLDGSWLLAFRQAAGGLAVRGASLRVLVHPDGALGSIKAFLLRDPPRGPDRLPDEEEIRLRVTAGVEAEVLGLERQWVFPTTDPASLRAAWCVKAEFAGTDVLELFYGADGERFAERPVAMGFVCKMEDEERRAHKAEGFVHGFGPAPRDIYATAGGSTTEAEYPMPGVIVRSPTEAKGDLTDDQGDFAFYVSNSVGIVQPKLAFGECDGTEIRTIFEVRRPTINKCADGDLILGEEERHEMAAPFLFWFNDAKEPVFAFEVMLYHHVRDFYLASKQILEGQRLHYERFFPLTVVASSFDESAIEKQPGEARYTPDQKKPKICMSRRKDRETWYPATIIQHEYAHHVIFTTTHATQKDEVVEGIADALTILRNSVPAIGYIAPGDPGVLGYSFEQKLEEIEAMRPKRGITRERWMVGRLFWNLYRRLEETGRLQERAQILMYRWLAANHAAASTDKAFELSVVMLEELLDADDRPGDRAFPQADGRRWNGTPDDFEIFQAFEDLPKPSRPFIRGDANASGAVDLSDAVATLVYLFQGLGGWPECLSAADANRSGSVDLSDGIYLLNFLFLGGPAPEAPFPGCGATDETLWCKQSGCNAMP